MYLNVFAYNSIIILRNSIVDACRLYSYLLFSGKFELAQSTSIFTKIIIYYITRFYFRYACIYIENAVDREDGL